MILVILLTALATAPAAPGGSAALACTADDANLPTDLRSWAQGSHALNAAADPRGRLPSLVPGRRAALTLKSASQIRFARAPEQSRSPSDSHGGLVRLNITSGGTYRFAAATPVWIDVLRSGRPQASVAHGHLAPCTSIRKVVEFNLSPGAYVVQLSGNPGPRADLLVAAKEKAQ